MLRWGLIPSWAKDPKIGNQCINAKAESDRRAVVAGRPAKLPPPRCRDFLGSMNGRDRDPVKQPMWAGLRRSTTVRVCGIVGTLEACRKGEPLETPVTIITTEPNELMQSIHNRAAGHSGPCILRPVARPDFPASGTTKALLRPYLSQELTAYPVSTMVNNSRHDAPQCLEPVSIWG